MNKNIEIKSIDYHRNGVTGEGFHIVLFKFEERNMLGIVFQDPSYIAVLDVDMVGKEEIKFGYNSWRGDWFEPSLREAIKKWEKDNE